MRILLAFIILFQHLFLYGCNFTNQLNNNDFIFSKKSIPDINVCNDPSTVNISVSKTKLSKLPKNPKDYITITTNIPDKLVKLKEFYNSSDIDLLKYYEYYYGGRPSLASFSLNISKKGTTSFFEKTLQDGCTSFDWDGTDNKGNFLEFGIYDIQIFFTYIFNGTVIKRPIVTSDFFRFDNYNSYVSYGTYYSYAPYSDYTIAPAAWYCGDILTMLRYCSQGYPSRPFFTTEEEKKQIDHTTIELVEAQDPPPLDPATTRFFNSEDFKKLAEKTDILKAPENEAQSLLDVLKQINILNAQLVSLNSRNTIDKNKISQISNQIIEVNSQKQNLESSLDYLISDLNYKKSGLESHINSITGDPNFVVYDDKPNDIGEYSDTIYHLNTDVIAYLGIDTITFYEPDKDDPDQTNLKEKWEVSPDRVELLDESDYLDASVSLLNEIKVLTDLYNDYKLNNFVFTNIDYNDDAIRNLNVLSKNINQHFKLINSSSKIFANSLEKKLDRMKDYTIELQSDFILPIATAMQKLKTNDPFVIQALKHSNIDIKKTSAKNLAIILKDYFLLAWDFLNQPLPAQETIVRIANGYSIEQWEAIKKVDNGVTIKAIIDAHIEMANATLVIPTTRLDLIPILGKGFKFLSKGSSLIKNLNPKNLKEVEAVAKELKNNATLSKEVAETIYSELPCIILSKMGILSFSTLAKAPKKEPCTSLKDLKSKVQGIKENKNLKKIFDNGGLHEIKDFLKVGKTTLFKAGGGFGKGAEKALPALVKAEKLADKPWKKDLFNLTVDKVKVVVKNGGMKVKKHPNAEFYGYAFEDIALYTINKSETSTKKFIGSHSWGAKDDFTIATKALFDKLSTQNPEKYSGVTYEQFKDFLTKFITWEHHPKFADLLAVPRDIHEPLKHWGSAAVARKKPTSTVKSMWEKFMELF